MIHVTFPEQSIFNFFQGRTCWRKLDFHPASGMMLMVMAMVMAMAMMMMTMKMTMMLANMLLPSWLLGTWNFVACGSSEQSINRIVQLSCVILFSHLHPLASWWRWNNWISLHCKRWMLIWLRMHLMQVNIRSAVWIMKIKLTRWCWESKT